MKKKVVSVVTYEEHGELHQDQHQNYSTTVTFDDQSWGIYAHKEHPNTHFVPGQEAEYDIKQQPGQNYMRLTKPKTGGGYGGGSKGWIPRSKGEVKRDAVTSSIKAAVELVIAGKVEFKEKEFNDAVGIIQGAINIQVDSIND